MKKYGPPLPLRSPLIWTKTVTFSRETSRSLLTLIWSEDLTDSPEATQLHDPLLNSPQISSQDSKFTPEGPQGEFIPDCPLKTSGVTNETCQTFHCRLSPQVSPSTQLDAMMIHVVLRSQTAYINMLTECLVLFRVPLLSFHCQYVQAKTSIKAAAPEAGASP